MASLGSPVLRAIAMGDYYQLIEGCHRARAAAELGIPVILEIIDVSKCFDADGYATELGDGPIQLVPGCEGVDLDGASVSDLTSSVGHLIECEVTP